MSNNQEQRETPPDLEADDDELMFASALPSASDDVPLDDEDEESPFGEPVARQKTATTTTNTVESSIDNEKNLYQPDKSENKVDEDDEDLFGVKNTNDNAPPLATPSQVPVAKPQSPPTTPVKQENPLSSAQPSSPIKQESPLFSTDSNVNSPQPVRATPTFESQTSSAASVSKSVPIEKVTASKTAPKRFNQNDIEITVSDPTKAGEGMSSYMTYRVTTKTTLPIFTKSEFSVNRRFSDFLGLHTKLVSKHLHTGIIVPSPPEKDSISMAKVKISKDEAIPTDFIDRRRALLERYLNRLARHSTLIEDPDVRQFLEMSNDLPKATSTQALSGAGVLRALSNISNQVTKLTAKTSEQDQWFEEKNVFVLELHALSKNLYNQFNTLFSQRKEAGHALKTLSASLNHLATTEEHPLLSSALIELASLEEKLDQVCNEQNLKEYSIVTELIKEYVSLLEMVELAFQERIRIHQQWLQAEDTLRKKRETKTKLESTKNLNKLPQAEMEIVDWEKKVERGKEDFESISTTIKQELEVFEQIRVDDFKVAVNNYLTNLLEQQEKVLQIWEAYLPEANKIKL